MAGTTGRTPPLTAAHPMHGRERARVSRDRHRRCRRLRPLSAGRDARLPRAASRATNSWAARATGSRSVVSSACTTRPRSTVAQPVGTVNSWVTGDDDARGRGIPMWAISGVTVAPDAPPEGHRPRDARGRAAHGGGAGLAIAGLTVSEADDLRALRLLAGDVSPRTGRSRRSARCGSDPRPDGRLDFIDRERLRDSSPSCTAGVRAAPRRDRGVAGLCGAHVGHRRRGRRAAASCARCATRMPRASPAGSPCTDCPRRAPTSRSTNSSCTTS